MEKTTILIVEDDFSAAQFLKELLSDIGYIVSAIVASGEEAIDIMNRNSPDIVLMDIELDGQLDGIQTAIKIQEVQFVPVIYITALKDKKTFDRAKATFPEFFLSKPFNKFQLLSVIDDVIGKKHCVLSKDVDSFKLESVFIKKNTTWSKVLVKNITYLKAEGSSTDLFTDNEQKFTISKNLDKTLNQLNSIKIQRIHRSYAINLDKIKEIDNWLVKIEGFNNGFVVQPAYKKAFEKIVNRI